MNIRQSAIALMIVSSTGLGVPLVAAQAEEAITTEGQQQKTVSLGKRRHGDSMPRWAVALDLTDVQKGQIKELVQKERQAKAPLMQQIREGKHQIQEATQVGTFNEEAVRLLMKHQAELRTELMISRIKLRGKIFVLLTPEQQNLAVKLLSFKEGQQHSRYHFQQG